MARGAALNSITEVPAWTSSQRVSRTRGVGGEVARRAAVGRRAQRHV